jgi:hypothetical protein
LLGIVETSDPKGQVSTKPGQLQVHVPPQLAESFGSSVYDCVSSEALHLDVGLRFHVTSELTRFVDHLLVGRVPVAERVGEPVTSYPAIAATNYRLWITRDLGRAKDYVRSLYADRPEARFGVLASSRDKLLARHGIDNDYQTTKRTRVGPWFAEGEENPLSCRHLATCATEFQAQGLELDMAVVGWGSDLIRDGSTWSILHSRRYRGGRVAPRDPMQLRLNAYRVLLTRGRDGTVVFVPQSPEMDETWEYFQTSGIRELP